MLNDLRDLWRYRELARLLVAKELKLRYRRSVLGFAWTMLNPLMTMIILTVVFSQVMRVQVDRFPVFVLCALLPWNFFAQSITGGSLSILHNESLLRNVRVPRAIFPICIVTSHFVNLLLALVPLLIVAALSPSLPRSSNVVWPAGSPAPSFSGMWRARPWQAYSGWSSRRSSFASRSRRRPQAHGRKR